MGFNVVENNFFAYCPVRPIVFIYYKKHLKQLITNPALNCAIYEKY